MQAGWWFAVGRDGCARRKRPAQQFRAKLYLLAGWNAIALTARSTLSYLMHVYQHSAWTCAKWYLVQVGDDGCRAYLCSCGDAEKLIRLACEQQIASRCFQRDMVCHQGTA